MENERKDKIEYRKEGDYYIPNLIVPKDEYADYCIGKYGRLRLNYLKNIVNNFILDFEKKAYSRGDGI